MDRIENILDTGGRYLSSADRQFVSTLLNELEQFQYQAPKDRALMFHPLGGFQRYLIHKVTEVFPKLTSFSIGDDSNRRTVVCFKGKKRDQQQDLQAVSNRSAKPDHPAPPPNTSVDEGRGARSRDSSRSRKKPEKTDSTDYYTRPTNTGSLSHLPKPLRNKKTSTKRDKMKRSRSLQSSPVHMNEHDPVEEDVRQGRRPRSTDAKRMPRSASLKPLNRKRETELSDAEKRSNTAPRRNVSEVSLHRRGQGLRMEGRVINGDVEDPYSCGDSCSDQGRVDAEALKKEKKRHADKTHKHRKHQQPPRSRHHSNSSVESADSFLTNEISHRSGHGAKGVNDDSDAEMKSSSSQEGSTTDAESTGTDEHPPSYSSLKPVASVKKAERNLNRIKRADSVKSGGKSDRDHRDSSSSNSSKRLARHASSKSTPKHERKSTSEHRSSTMPRAPSSDPPLRRKSDKRSQTLKGSSVPRNKGKVIDTATHTEDKLRKRPSSASGKREKHHRVKPSNSKKALSPDSLRISTDDLLDGSNTTLYMPLPSNKSEEKRNKSATKGSPSKQASKPMMRCDSGAQTEVSGTLSRKPTKQPSSSSMSHPEAASNPEKHPNDLLATMVQYLGLQPPGSTAFQSPLHQNSVNAFQQYLSHMNHQLNSQHPTHVPSLPAHLSHQLYLSWLGAYYAGAAGTWPPPAPPAFLMPHLAAAANSGMPTFDMPPYTGYSPQHEQPRYQEPKGLYEHFNVPSHQEPFNGDDGLVNGGKHRTHPSGMENTAKSGVGDFMKRQNYPGFEAPAFGADYDSYSSNPALNQPKKQEEDLSHEDESLAPTDEESGAGEVAVTSSSKGGLMVYVRSRSTSRASSTTGTRGSVESLNVSDNMHSPSCTSRNSEPSCRSSASDRKKSSSKSPKLRKSAHSKQAKNAGERVESSNSLTNRDNNQHSVKQTTSKHEVVPSPIKANKGRVMAADAEQASDEQAGGDEGATHEEMILSLRRAPLATMEDDYEALMSGSHASSCSSINSNHLNTPRKGPKTSDRESTKSISEGSSLSASTTADPTLASDVEPATDMTHPQSSGREQSDSEESVSSSTMRKQADAEEPAHPDDAAPSRASPTHAEATNDDLKAGGKTAITEEKPKETIEESVEHATASDLPDMELSVPDNVRSFTAPDDVLLIDDTSEDDAPDNDLNGSAQSDASTISDGGAPHDVSDSSYDADQSRFDDSRDTRAPTDALFKEVDGDIVVQDPQFDYYAWQPKEDEFAGEQYLKFVEVSDFPADISDISVTQKLSKYRGLRLTRVDPTHALCFLTSKEQAVQLLNDTSLPFTIRALCEAAAKTKQKAKEKLESIQFDEVRSQRPKSSAVVAKRMIAGALGDSKFAPHDGAKSKRERSLKKGKPESR